MLIFWILIFVFMMLGFFTGYLIPFTFPSVIFPYLTIVFLALFDGLLYGVRLVMSDTRTGALRIVLRVIIEIIFGFVIVFYGEHSGLDLYLVAVVPLGAAIFLNFQQMFSQRGQVA